MARGALFRFLNLPVELRLMIYDCLPLKTRHHIIIIGGDGSPDPVLVIVSRRIPGISILTTCHKIYNEAMVLRQRVTALSIRPLRLIIDAEDLVCPPVEEFLHCATLEQDCINRISIDNLLGERTPNDDLYGKDAHKQLHHFLLYNGPTGRRHAVKVVIKY